MRRANRKDTVQADIVKGLRAHGIGVLDMPDPGDILTYGRHYTMGVEVFIPMECKSDQPTRGYKPELTPAQQRRAKEMVIPIVHNLREALALFGILQT